LLTLALRTCSYSLECHLNKVDRALRGTMSHLVWCFLLKSMMTTMVLLSLSLMVPHYVYCIDMEGERNSVRNWVDDETIKSCYLRKERSSHAHFSLGWCPLYFVILFPPVSIQLLLSCRSTRHFLLSKEEGRRSSHRLLIFFFHCLASFLTCFAYCPP
jgi:hypothetical protein